LEDAAAQFLWGGSNSVDRTDDGVHQVVHVERTAVGEFAFGERPNPLIGIELRRVSWKVLDVQAPVPTEELAERCPMVRRGVVEQNDDRTPQVAQQLAEEETHFFLPDVVEVKQRVESEVLSSGADRDSRDDGDFVPASLPMTLKGGAALRCPSPDHQGSQQEARFIGKN
jgi:hypothetical protein